MKYSQAIMIATISSAAIVSAAPAGTGRKSIACDIVNPAGKLPVPESTVPTAEITGPATTRQPIDHNNDLKIHQRAIRHGANQHPPRHDNLAMDDGSIHYPHQRDSLSGGHGGGQHPHRRDNLAMGKGWNVHPRRTIGAKDTDSPVPAAQNRQRDSVDFGFELDKLD